LGIGVKVAHFAQINENNIVQEIIVVDNKHAPTEEAGVAFIKDVLKLNGTWLQTSYNSNIRGKFAGVTDIYDPKKDEFTTNFQYAEELKKLRLEREEKEAIKIAEKEAIAAKIGLTVEELQAILKQ
jgi:hypothetical protein